MECFRHIERLAVIKDALNRPVCRECLGSFPLGPSLREDTNSSRSQKLPDQPDTSSA